MINKKLLSFDRGALRYVELNVLFQWLGMLCNVVFVKAVAGLIGAAFAGSLTSALLWQQLVLCLTVALTNTLILLTVLAVLGTSLSLYQSGRLGAEGVLVCTLSALSSFGPVVALANLGVGLTQVFASADRVLDLLEEEPVTADVTDGTDTAFAGAAADISFSVKSGRLS